MSLQVGRQWGHCFDRGLNKNEAGVSTKFLLIVTPVLVMNINQYTSNLLFTSRTHFSSSEFEAQKFTGDPFTKKPKKINHPTLCSSIEMKLSNMNLSYIQGKSFDTRISPLSNALHIRKYSYSLYMFWSRPTYVLPKSSIVGFPNRVLHEIHQSCMDTLSIIRMNSSLKSSPQRTT